MKGKIRDYNDKAEDDWLWLDFTFPDSLPYKMLRNTDPGYETSDIQRYFEVSYYACFSSSFDLTYSGIEGKIVSCAFALDPNREYIIMQWNNERDQFLVASLDPNAAVGEIMKHFQTFLDSYAFDGVYRK